MENDNSIESQIDAMVDDFALRLKNKFKDRLKKYPIIDNQPNWLSKDTNHEALELHLMAEIHELISRTYAIRKEVLLKHDTLKEQRLEQYNDELIDVAASGLILTARYKYDANL